MSTEDTLPDESKFEDELGWLVDIPLFLDQERVAQLYDLTIQPIFHEYQRTPVEKNLRELQGESNRVAGGVEAGVEGGGMMSMIASGKLKGWIEGEYTKTEEDEESLRYELTQTPQRQLAQIAIQYFLADYGKHSNEGGRNYHYVSASDDPVPSYQEKRDLPDWLQTSAPSEPRDLVVLELPGIDEIQDDSNQVPTKLVPTAAEFEDGTVVELYQKFEERYEKPPRYPERDKEWGDMGSHYKHIDDDNHPLADVERDANATIGENVYRAQDYYWKWFENRFSGKKVTDIVESACKAHGDIRWIDFRLPLNDTGFTLHLHIQAREEYNTGTFAYNLIKRGNKHGLLLVGTIKSEPDMDVLAIYER